jgi:hypothetical protein
MARTIRLLGQQQRDIAKCDVDRAPPGYVVTIREPTRTGDQNAKMWAMLSDIARAKPQGRALEAETWKVLFMDSIGKKPRWEPSLDGDGVVNTGYRSSRLRVAEMAELIEAIYEYGAVHGVQWSE